MTVDLTDMGRVTVAPNKVSVAVEVRRRRQHGPLHGCASPDLASAGRLCKRRQPSILAARPVRPAQAGALLGRVYYDTWKQAGEGYAVVAGTCPNVGVAGHILSGGFSYISPQFGLACDSLLSLEMVTAAGQV